jgi:restriction system protein
MSGTSVPPPGHMLWPALEAVREHGDSVTIEEHDEAVAEKLGLTDEQLSELHNDGPDTEFRYRMRWTRTGLKNAGTLANSSPGVWVLTDLGRTVDEAELEELAKRSKAQAREARGARGEPDELEAEAAWAEELLDRLTAISADGFER